MISRGSKWASCLRPRLGARAKLFCFPYAGGGSTIYRDWADEFPDAIEVWVVHLPGRERRITDKPIGNIHELAAAATAGLREHFGQPFALFGHSLGALAGFEVARLLHRDRLNMPFCLAVSGFGAPHIPSPRAPTAHLPDGEFLAELHRLKGTPPSVLDNPELLEIILPMLRADFQAVETYRFVGGAPLPCPILAYGGANDQEAPAEHVKEWRMHTNSTFCMRFFAGDHFYLHPLRAELVQCLANDVLGVLQS